MAQSRFDTRRAAALQEANAIGTAWLRAHAIGHERGPAIARLLENYIWLRIGYVRAGPDQMGLSAISQRTSDMQGVMLGPRNGDRAGTARPGRCHTARLAQRGIRCEHRAALGFR